MFIITEYAALIVSNPKRSQIHYVMTSQVITVCLHCPLTLSPTNMWFYLKKRMKECFAYVLEFMLTFDKMQNTSPLMNTKFEI